MARPVTNLEAFKALDDTAKLYDMARTLRADAIIIANSSAAAFATRKLYGTSFYGVSGSVELRAIITDTSQEISSGKFSASTGRRPAGSLGEGAARCLTPSANKAAGQIIYKIAAALVTGSSNNDITINIKLSNVLFDDVARIESELRELAGRSGEIFERSYKDNLLEIVFTSKHTAREAASFLSGHGFTVTALTNWSIDAVTANKAVVNIARNNIINVKILDVPSFSKSGEIESLLKNFVQSSNGVTSARYQEKTLELIINLPNTVNNEEFAKSTAAFLEGNNITIESVSPNFVSGRLIQEAVKHRGLW